MRHTSTGPPWGVILLVVKRFPVVGDRSRSFGSRDYGDWMKPVDQLSTIAANPPASPLAQPRERNRINHSLPAGQRKLIEGTSRGAGPSTVWTGEDARQPGDAGNLDRDGGERPGWRTDPRRDVVGSRDRHPSRRGQSARLAGNPGRRPGPGPHSSLLDREQGGKQLLARADPSPGRRCPIALPLGRRARRQGDCPQRPPGLDRPAE